MASIQQSLNTLFAASMGAAFTITQSPGVKNMMAVRDAKKSLKASEDEAKAIYENSDLNFQDRVELLSGVADRESEEMERLASLTKSGTKAAEYRQKAQYLRQDSEGYKKLSQRMQAQMAAQRQAEAQRSRAEVEQAVKIRRAIIQDLSPERQKEIMKEAQNGKK